MSFSSDSTTADVPSPRHRLYKTKMCKHFLRGNCLYGVHCAFSHADADRGCALGLPPPQPFSLAHHIQELSSEDPLESSRRALVDEVMVYGLAEPQCLSPTDLKRLIDPW